MRARIGETLGLLGVLVVLGGWLVFVWVIAHAPVEPSPTREIRDQGPYPWERPGAYQVRVDVDRREFIERRVCEAL